MYQGPVLAGSEFLRSIFDIRLPNKMCILDLRPHHVLQGTLNHPIAPDGGAVDLTSLELASACPLFKLRSPHQFHQLPSDLIASLGPRPYSTRNSISAAASGVVQCC